MGPFAKAIVIIMALMSVASVIVFFERGLFYLKSKSDSRAFAERLAPLLGKGDLEEAASKAPKANQGHLGRVIFAGLTAKKEAEELSDADDAREMVFESVARSLERQSQREVAVLRRGNSVLGTVSASVPFVGLLGTVMGIVTAFQDMQKTGSGGFAAVAGGIAEALVTTAFGLLVAIPAVWAFNFLSGWVDARSVDISESSNELLDVVARRLHLTFKRRPVKA
jgi:biopolymer transport protein ExbB/biopolymer transport protein TolQ